MRRDDKDIWGIDTMIITMGDVIVLTDRIDDDEEYHYNDDDSDDIRRMMHDDAWWHSVIGGLKPVRIILFHRMLIS